MIITFWKGLYVADSSYEEGALLKSAGFIWHDPKRRDGNRPHMTFRCSACRAGAGTRWWTKRIEVAARLQTYCNERALAALAGHIKTVEESRATSADYEFPIPPWKIAEGKDYLPYQKAGIGYAVQTPARKCRGVLYADEPGLGKTIEAIGYINTIRDIESVLVICPARLRINWMRECFGDASIGRTGWIFPQGRTFVPYVVDNDDPVPTSANFVIVNYERTVIGTIKCPVCSGDKAKECHECKGKGLPEDTTKIVCEPCNGKGKIDCAFCKGKGRILGDTNRAVVESLMSRRWGVLIADEAHRLKNKIAGRTIAVLGDQEKGAKFRKGGIQSVSDRILLLTGTPLVNGRPSEMHPFLSTIAPEKFGLFWPYARRFCGATQEIVGGGKAVWRFDGASRLGELQEALRSTCMVRRLKKDVLKDLPPKTREIVVLPPGDAIAALREEMEEWESDWEDDVELAKLEVLFAQRSGNPEDYRAAASQLKYVLKVAFDAMSRIRHALALAKLPLCLEHTDSLLEESDIKITIWAHHRDIIEKTLAHFGNIAVRVYGGMNDAKAQKAVDRFQNDPTCRIFIGQIQAAGEGITLTQAQAAIFYELSWVPSEVSQAEDRAHRIGQLANLLCQQLVIDGSLDAKFVHTIVAKQDAADEALDLATEAKVEMLGTPIVPEREFPPVPVEEKRLLKKGLFHLASTECFSKFDGQFGRRLAARDQDFTDPQAYGARRLCHKYRRRLPEEIAKGLSMWESPEEIALAEMKRKARTAEKRAAAKKMDREERQLALPTEPPPEEKIDRSLKAKERLTRLTQDIDHHRTYCPLCDDTGLCTTAVDIESRLQAAQEKVTSTP
jgi:hypothetical protein